MKCVICGAEFTWSGRGREPLYCSATCRKRASRLNAPLRVPVDMALADRWVLWKRMKRGDGSTKKPLTVDGHAASSTDRSTWSSLIAVEEAEVGDGLGFTLGSGFACIDLDHCYDSRNHLADWAKMLLAPVEGKTFIELSPSGDGLHIWGRTREQTGLKVRGLMNVEAYSQGRYMTVTGKPYKTSVLKLADLSYLFDVMRKLS